MNNGIPTITARERPWYPALDGIRGIAILGVLVFHNFSVLPFSGLGRFGVDLFFVLSGFLITDILLGSRQCKHALFHFYLRRATRIFPLYYAVVFLFFLFAGSIHAFRDQYSFYGKHALYVWLQGQNFLTFAYHSDSGISYLMSHFWSLSLEEQFYLIWPFLILYTSSLKRITLILYIILFTGIALRIAVWFLTEDHITYAIFNSVFRLDGFIIGGLIACWKKTGADAMKKLLKLFLFLVICEMILYMLSQRSLDSIPHFIAAGYAVLAAGFGIGVCSSTVREKTRATAWLQNGILRWLGSYSYGIYVYHWPLLIMFRLLLPHRLISWGLVPDTANLITGCIALGLTLPLSYLSYHCFEKWFLRAGRKFSIGAV